MYDIIIIGAGPAGLTAALYARRANKKVLVLEGISYGGQIINASLVENYPGVMDISGFDLATNLYNQVVKLGAEIKYERVIEVTKERKVKTTENEYAAKAIIIATGAEKRKLGIKREEELTSKGVSYCATCDGNFYKNKVTAVVGGGNTALEDTIYLSNIAKKVYLIHRRDSFKGENKYLEELNSKDNVEFILNSNIIKLNGKSKLESIEVKDNDDNIKTIDVDGLFIAVGQIPKNEMFDGLLDMENGYIVVDDDMHTSVDKIYAIGDTRVKKLRQLTTAVSDGAIAATTAIKEMEE